MRIRGPELVVLVASCGSYTTYQSAEPLAPGRWQGAVALGPGVFVDQPGETKTPSVHLEVGARRGVGADVDLGFKLYALGIEGSARYRFYQSETDWSFAVLGAVGGLRSTGRGTLPDALVGHVRLTGAITKRTSTRWAYTFGPLFTGSLYLPAGGGHATGLLVGVFGNFEWTFKTRWHLVPELSLHRTAAGDVPVDGSVAQLGIGLARDW